MAEILDGLSDHKSHAPLSHGQTVAICQHLQQISETNSNKIEQLVGKLTQTDAERSKIRNDVVLQTESLDQLKSEVATLRVELAKKASEASHAVVMCERLKGGLVRTGEDLSLLRDGQKITNTNVHNLKEDIKMRSADIAGIRSEVDDILKKQITYLQEKQNTTILSLKQVISDHAGSKTELAEQKEWLRGLGANLNNVEDQVRHLNSVVKEQTGTIAEACLNGDQTRKNLEMTNGVVLNLSESVETLQVSEAGLLDNVRSMEAYVQRLADEHGATVKGVHITREGLERAKAATERTREELTKALNDVTALQQDQSRTVGVVQKLNTDIQRVGIIAADTKANLEATQSIVLPNLGADELAPMSSRGTATTMDTTSRSWGPGGSRGGKSPRKRREATWTARNIGSVPDRMSYI